MPVSDSASELNIRVIAFYRFTALSVPPLDTTENIRIAWQRVRHARPNFVDQYQPHVPRELGYYDSNSFAAREAQAHLARSYGVSAFCYFCAWDRETGTLIPTADELMSPILPSLPFCVCWENAYIDPISEQDWDKRRSPYLYSRDQCFSFIQSVIPMMRDRRYVRINDRPLIIIAQPHTLVDADSTLQVWRDECVRAGVNDPYLVCYGTAWGSDPYGFDAAVELPPAGFYPESYLERVKVTNPKFRGEVRSYRSMLAQWLAARRPGHKLFQTVMPAWDETASNQNGAMIFVGSTPELFAQWTERALQRTAMRFDGDERLLFVRSWNEWGLGCHLEPDLRYGCQYLEAVRGRVTGAVARVPERPTLADVKLRANGAFGNEASRIVRPNSDWPRAQHRVSVVMPAYNHERYVVQALDSVFAQSHDNLEVIVVDDGSRDATGALVDDYAKHSVGRRITVVHQQNAGAHDALNHGLSLASGDYVALINSDDLYAPMRLEWMLGEMRRQRSAFSFSNTTFIDEQGEVIGNEDAYVSELREAIAAGADAPDPLYGFIVTNIAISTSNFLFDRALLELTGGFCNMQVCHDWDFVMRASFHTSLLFVREPLYSYRLHRRNTFAGRKLLGGLEIEQLQTEFFAGIERHPLASDPDRAEHFFAHARSSGLGAFLPERWQLTAETYTFED